MIRTRGLTKSYGGVRAVDGIDLDVREGDVYGFLGANGSGKTTTVRMLLGLVLASAGEVELFGEPMPRAAASTLPRIGALVEGPGAYPHLSGRANLAPPRRRRHRQHAARRRAPRRITEALEQVGLDPGDRRPVRTYSLGMRQRLGLAVALMRRPQLLVLDEPTNGLDPQGIRRHPRPAAAAQRGRHHDLPLQPPARRDRADVHPGRRARPRPARAPGRRWPRCAHRPAWCGCARPTSRRRSRCSTAASSTARRRRSSYALRRPGGAQRRARAGGRPGRRARARAPQPRGDRARATPSRRGRVVIRVELVKLLRRPRTWVTIAGAERPAHAGRGAARRHRPRPASRAPVRRSSPPCSPTAPCSRSPPSASCCRCSCRSRSPSSAATRSPARRRAARCATCWCGRSARLRLLVAKLVSVVAFVVLATLAVAVVAYVEGRLLPRRRPGHRGGQRLRLHPDRDPDGAAHGDGLRLRRAGDARRRRDRAAAEHDHRLGGRRGPGHDRVPGRLDGAARPGRRRVAAALPAHALLAGVRRPVPRPDPVARRRSTGCWRSWPTWSCSPAPPGPTSPPRTSTADASRGRRGRAPRPSALRSGGQHHRVAGQLAVAWSSRPGRAPAPEVQRALERGRVAGRDDLVVVGAHGDPPRPVGRLVTGVEPRSRSLPVASCSHAVGQPRPPRSASAATSVPWCGEPSVSTRRTTAAPPSSRTKSRAITPPAE